MALTPVEQQTILALHGQGVTIPRIAADIGHSAMVIEDFLYSIRRAAQSYFTPGANPRFARPDWFSEPDSQQMARSRR